MLKRICRFMFALLLILLLILPSVILARDNLLLGPNHYE